MQYLTQLPHQKDEHTKRFCKDWVPSSRLQLTGEKVQIISKVHLNHKTLDLTTYHRNKHFSIPNNIDNKFKSLSYSMSLKRSKGSMKKYLKFLQSALTCPLYHSTMSRPQVIFFINFNYMLNQIWHNAWKSWHCFYNSKQVFNITTWFFYKSKGKHLNT